MDCGEFGRMPAEAEDKDFAPLPEDDEALEPCPRVRDVRIGRANSTLSVRIVSFLIDNNIFHRLNPHLVASHEQLAFMVALEQDQVYVPCSDRVLFDLLGDELTLRIRREYGRAWRICVMLLNSLDVDPVYRTSVLSFCRQRLKRALLFHDIIPSRLIKRLTSFALSSDNALEDPWAERRARATARARELLGSDELKALLDRAPASCADTSYAALQERIDMGRMARLLCLCCHSPDMVAKRGPGLWNDFLEAEEALARVWGRVPGLMDRHSSRHLRSEGRVLLQCAHHERHVHGPCAADGSEGRVRMYGQQPFEKTAFAAIAGMAPHSRFRRHPRAPESCARVRDLRAGLEGGGSRDR